MNENKAPICYLSLMMIVLFFSSCIENVSKYEGRIIEMDFTNLADSVKPDSWVQIDEWRLTHVHSLKEGDTTAYSLPSSRIEVASNEEKSFDSRIHPRVIGLHIVRNLQIINRDNLKDDAPKYTVLNPGMLSVAGKLQIVKTDSSMIKVIAPEGYPIPIRIIEE